MWLLAARRPTVVIRDSPNSYQALVLREIACRDISQDSTSSHKSSYVFLPLHNYNDRDRAGSDLLDTRDSVNNHYYDHGIGYSCAMARRRARENNSRDWLLVRIRYLESEEESAHAVRKHSDAAELHEPFIFVNIGRHQKS
jgi:hypothetical protein